MAQSRKANPVSVLTRLELAPEEIATESRLNGSPTTHGNKKRRRKSSKRRASKRLKASAGKARGGSKRGRARSPAQRVSAMIRDSWRPIANKAKQSRTWHELVDGLGTIAEEWKRKVEELRETQQSSVNKIENLVQREIVRNIEQGLDLIKRTQKIASREAKRRGFKRTAQWIDLASKKIAANR